MVNDEIILRKTQKLKEYTNELRQAKDITWEKYQKNIRDRAFVERYIHIAIQTVFDIANHIIPVLNPRLCRGEWQKLCCSIYEKAPLVYRKQC